MGRTVGRRTHERRQRPGLRAGAGPATGSDVARVGRAHPGARPDGPAVRSRAGIAEVAGQRAQRAVSLRSAGDVRHAGDRGKPPYRRGRRAAHPRRRRRRRGRRALAPERRRVKGFYMLLATVALIGGGVIWYGSRSAPAAAPVVSAPPPLAASDGFKGFKLGAESAPIEVTEYSDFECPFCASFATVQMPVIREQLIAPGKVRWRYRDFPLPSHQYSRYAALAAQCAGEQGKFWEMHDQLFTNHQWAQTGKNPRSLFRDFAQAAGLDLDKYDACMDGQRYAARIQASVQEGEALNVGGTPTFFVNGKRFDGHPTSDAFKSLVAGRTKPTKPRK